MNNKLCMLAAMVKETHLGALLRGGGGGGAVMIGQGRYDGSDGSKGVGGCRRRHNVCALPRNMYTT